MDPQTKAQIEFDVAQFTARQKASQPHDFSKLSDEARPYVFAHAAFALIDQAIAEHALYMRSQGAPIEYKRRETGVIVSLGLRRVSFMLKLNESLVRIGFYSASPYPGAPERAEFVAPRPADVVPIDHLDEPIKVFMEDMRAFLLHGRKPLCAS